MIKATQANKHIVAQYIYYVRLIAIAFILFAQAAWAQGISCAQAEPLCADPSANLIFENSYAGNSQNDEAESGIDYTCSSSEPQGDNNPKKWPYPAWYYIQIEQAGDLAFTIIQNSEADQSGEELDIDFQAWGPFNTSTPNCQTELTPAKQIDCSWSKEATEELHITNAQADEFYILMLTNWSTKAGWISVEQTNYGQPNAGTTNCDIVLPNLGQDREACKQETVTLDASTPTTTSYEWYVDQTPDNGVDNFTLITGQTSATLTITNNVSGIYKVIAHRNGGNQDSDEVRVTFTLPERMLDQITACTEDRTYTLPDGREVAENGTYQIMNTEECFLDIYTINFEICDTNTYCKPEVPTAFAPNSNNVNETFAIFNPEECSLQVKNIYIYDRWGNKVYSNTSNIAWDGTNEGKHAPVGIYLWEIEYTYNIDEQESSIQKTSGNIYLIR